MPPEELDHLRDLGQLTDKYARYANDPVGFFGDVLNVQTVPAQRRALESLLEPPYRTLVPSANETGKTIMAGGGVLWWHCTRQPAIIVTTGPKKNQLRDTVWKEVRKLARIAGLPVKLYPKDTRIERAPDDFAVGTTAASATAFQGQHGANLFFIIEEATAVAAEFWDAIESMFSPPGHAILALFNPTAIGTRVYDELMGTEGSRQKSKSWHVVRMSALDHPNIEAELRGEPPVVRHAIRLEKFERLLYRWSRPVGCDLADRGRLHKTTDLVWPPDWATEYCRRTGQRPQWYRPGPLAEARLLGRYPTQGVDSVWGEGDWIAATREGLDPLPIQLVIPEIGCDVAAMGDDNTAIHVRSGFCSLYHEEVNGQNEPATMERLKYLADYYARWFNEQLGMLPEAGRIGTRPVGGRDVPIKIDNDGLGGTLSSFLEREGYRVMRVGAGTKAIVEEDYPNRRSELWFATAEMARDEQLDLSRLPEDVVEEARKQALKVTWSFDIRGRRLVMPKDEMKKVMVRSPDTMDALNLAFAAWPEELYGDAVPQVVTRRRDPTAPY